MSTADELKRIADDAQVVLEECAVELNCLTDLQRNNARRWHAEQRADVARRIAQLTEKRDRLEERAIDTYVDYVMATQMTIHERHMADYERLGDNAPRAHDWINDERATRRA